MFVFTPAIDTSSKAQDDAPASSLGEVFDDNYNAIKLNYEYLSRDRALEDAYDARIAKVKDATGIELQNPYRVNYGSRGGGVAPSFGHGYDTESFQARLAEIAAQHPDKQDLIAPDRPVAQDAYDLARGADEKSASSFDRYPGAARWLAYTGAGLAAGVTDPVNALALAFGPFGEVGAGAKAVLWAGIKAGAANAATEAAVQPFVQSWRKEAGLDYGFSQAAANVTFAGLFGFAADAGVRGAYRGAKSFFGKTAPEARPPGAAAATVLPRPPSPSSDPIAALDDAALRLPEGATLRKAAEGDEKALSEVAHLTDATSDPAVRGALEELKREMLFGPTPDVDRGEHFERLADAIQRSLDPEALPPGAAIRGAEPPVVKPGQPLDAKIEAARQMLREERGTPLDMATLLRERPDLATRDLPLSDYKMRQAIGLSKLSSEAFDRVANGEVPPHFAAIVGDTVDDASEHARLIDALAKAKPKNVQQARLFLGQQLAKPTSYETHAARYGSDAPVRDLLPERSQVLDQALKALKVDKRVFTMLQKEAPRIESAGNILDHEANIDRAELSDKLLALVERLAQTPSVVSDMLQNAALGVANGVKPKTAAGAFARQIAGIMEKDGIDGLLRKAPKPELLPRQFDDPFGPEAKAQTEELAARQKQREEDDGEQLAALTGANSKARKNAETVLKLGRSFVVPERTIKDVYDAIEPARHLIPEGTRVGVLAKIETVDEAFGLGPDVVAATYRAPDGSSFRQLSRRVDVLSATAAYRHDRRTLVFNRLGAILPDLAPELVGFLRGKVAHESLHALRRQGGNNLVIGNVWVRLLDRAKALRVLDSDHVTLQRRFGDPEWPDYQPGDTTRELYERLYQGAPDFQERMDQEHVAHLIELDFHGELSAEERAPVADLLDKFLSGEFSGAPAPIAAAVLREAPTTPKPDNDLFAFAGRLAKTADLEDLELAQRMERAGAGFFEIRLKTGWERGADGDWRFELSDRAASLESGKLAAGVTEGRYDEIIDNPLVLEAYPELKGYTIKITRRPGAASGSVNFAGKRMEIEAGSAKQAILKIIHETQHVIQRKEGWAEGGSPLIMGEFVRKAVADIDAQAAAELEKITASEGMLAIDHAPIYARLAELQAERAELDKQSWVSLYLRLAGEVEARNVERRWRMLRGERFGHSMQLTEDVVRAEQIIARGNHEQRSIGGGDDDDWQSAYFDDMSRRGTANEWYQEQQLQRPVFEKPKGKAALERAADDLSTEVGAFEAALWKKGVSVAEIAQSIERKFGFAVDPDDIAKSKVWWRINDLIRENSTREGRANVRWSEEELAFAKRLTEEGLSQAEIMRQVNERFDRRLVHESSVRSALNQHGVVMPSGRADVNKWTREMNLWLAQRYLRNKAHAPTPSRVVDALERQFGQKFTSAEIKKQVQRLGLLADPEIAARTKAKANEAWTPKADALLRQGYEEGLSTNEIALKISRETDLDVTKNSVAGRRTRLETARMRDELREDLKGETRSQSKPRGDFTAEMKKRLADADVVGLNGPQAAELLNREFKTNVAYRSVIQQRERLGLPVARKRQLPDDALAFLKRSDVLAMTSREATAALKSELGIEANKSSVWLRLRQFRAEAQEAERSKELGSYVEVCKK